MKTTITEYEKRITIKDIQQIEESFDIVIPENLKKLYLKYNGGIIDIDNESYDFDSIKYGMTTIEESIDSLQITEQHITKEYLPFATSPVGHIVCIYTAAGKRKGQIFLFRYDELEPIFYNNSLEEFLNIKSIDDL
ncbi:SMI1/KNR4 family protein [Chryseobacterium viscerum]|uniref:SMI1/KNR4 family protein n=1 Tax=Chryseobacterium viscerum TaxID=1037377 RepID=A0A316WDM0_9FLAO|nr:SMI1/KNR4 family protein [Chryseobacterium viscerum]PWN58146.1 SMI1/KNR4 family protein [Chryseobacterium viscerum]